MGKKYIISNRNKIKLETPSISLDKAHKLYHKYSRSKLFPKSKISEFIQNPLNLLKLQGEKRVNILIFLAFIGQEKLPSLENLTGQQKQVVELISRVKDAWKDLIKIDVYSFLKLEKYLGIDTSRDILKGDLRLRVLDACGVRAAECEVKKYTFSRIHQDFCEHKPQKNYIKRIMEIYSKLIKKIKADQVGDEILEHIPFYEEINMYNDYIITKYELKYFDASLLSREFHTVNERGIRDFIKRKIEEQSLSRDL